MPGMHPGLNSDDPALVAAFRSALLHQLGIVTALLVLLLLSSWAVRNRRHAASSAPPLWVLLRLPGGAGRNGRHAASPAPPPRPPADVAEARARRLLRISFGIFWIIDGVLQAQPQMAGGLVSRVIR